MDPLTQVLNDNTFQNLELLFESDPTKAINESQKMIYKSTNFDSYEEFYSYHLNNPRISTCQNEWQDNRMSIHCFNCSLNSSSCVCLDCFLKGNHQGHDYIICPDTIGNCDCGDISLWKRSGFCANHQGLDQDDNHPENYLDENLRVILTDIIFKAAFSALKKLTIPQDNFTTEIFQFVSSFLKFGDGFRRLIAISLTEKIDFCDLLNNIIQYTFVFNNLLLQLCGNLVSDQIFKQNFSKATFNAILNHIKNYNNDEKYQLWDNFLYHAFSPLPIQYCIQFNKWDWSTFSINFFNELKEFFNNVGDEELINQIPSTCSEFVTALFHITSIQPNEQTQTFFDRLFSEVLNSGTRGSLMNNTTVTASFNESRENTYYSAAQKVSLILKDAFNCFKFKKNLKVDVMIEQLDKHTDIAPIYKITETENDRYALKYIKETNNQNYPSFFYDSFHNGSSFFLSNLLYDSFVSLSGTENINRIKIARLLLNENYQSLRVKLGIITMKKILSFVCLNQSLIPKKNFAILKTISPFEEDPFMITMGIPRYLPVFQLLIGLQCQNENEEFGLKDFFAFEMAREVGLFDDFASDRYKDEDVNEVKKTMTFSFLYLSLLLVIERVLFNFNCNDFIREQLIFALKTGVSDLSELSQSYDRRVLDDYQNPTNFNTVFFSIATIKTHQSKKVETDKNQPISFILKDDVKLNAISGINPINQQKALLNNEISKDPENLIKIQDFESEDSYFFNTSLFSTSSLTSRSFTSPYFKIDNEMANYEGLKIRLKEFLMTPTVLAVIYHSMRTTQEIDLNDHLSLNILILISKFFNDEKSDTNKKEVVFNDEIHYESINELISKIRTFVFNYKVDNDGNAVIENTLKTEKTAFVSLLNLRISYENDESKSFIDVIRSKGEIGKKALSMMSITSDNDIKSDTNNDTDKNVKKQRANKLKEEIMNKYKNMISNYNVNEHHDDNEININEASDSIDSSGVINGVTDVCSICSAAKKSEALTYPLFIYSTKFPFIVDKPPLVDENFDEISVSCDDDLDYDESDDENQNEEEEDESNEFEDEENLTFEEQIDAESQLIDEMLQRLINARETGSMTNDEITAGFNELRERSQELMARKEIYERNKFARQIQRNRKIIKKEHRQQKLIEMKKKIVKQKRYAAGANFILQFSICQHLVHPKCVESEVFQCPIDRTIKNGFLPNLNSIQKSATVDSLSNEVKHSISLFFDVFKKFLIPTSKRLIDTFVELIKSLSGLIVTFEVRIRSLPASLDSSNTKLLARNLFLTTWYAYRIQGKPKMTDMKPYNNLIREDVESRLTEFQKFIKKLIECDDIQNESSTSFQQIVSSFVHNKKERSKQTEKEIFLFLRRVCLTDYFLLDNDVRINNDDSNYYNSNASFKEYVEWDEVLSLQNLSTKYEFNFSYLNDEFEFKPFIFSKLPKEFLHFASEPYNFPVELTSNFVIYNLIDYNYLIDNYDDINDDEDVDEKKEKCYMIEEANLQISLALNFAIKHYPSALLFIGKFASRILIINSNYTTSLRPFYFDKFGFPDFGFVRGQPLYLNNERYERFVDEILSGNFSNSL